MPQEPTRIAKKTGPSASAEIEGKGQAVSALASHAPGGQRNPNGNGAGNGAGTPATTGQRQPEYARTRTASSSTTAAPQSGSITIGEGDADDSAPVRRVGKRRAAGPARGRIAANDDGPSIGGLLFALHQKPSGRPFFYAGVGSVVWGLLSILLAWALLSAEATRAESFLEVLTRPVTLSVAAAVVIPIVLFWFLATLNWRAHELRLMSSAMTEVAVRLAEPDKLAEQSVASLGQSVRRQVGAMNDAISRALGRAGELEALVHNEVAALERSYSDNEFRIRNLIDELASERSALENKSGDVSGALRGIGDSITRDIAAASDQAARTIAEASQMLARAIDSQGSDTSERLRQAGERLNRILRESSDETAHLVSERGNSLLASLTDMNQRIGHEVPAIIEKLGHEQTRLTKILEGSGKNLAALETVLAQRTGSLETALGERTRHLQLVLEDKTRAIDAAVGGFESILESKTHEIGARIGGYANRMLNRIDELDASISERSDAIESALSERSRALDSALIERTKAIDVAFSERISLLDERLVGGANAIDDVIGQRASALRNAMDRHAQTLSDSLDRQARDLDETMVQGIAAVRRTSENIANQSLSTIEGLANQAGVLRQISEQLLGQIDSLTTRFEGQGQSITRAAHALESSNFKIDSVLGERHAELATLLDTMAERASQFETLMQSYSHNLETSLSSADDEAQRALHTLQSRFSTVSTEMSEQLSHLSSRLNQSSDDLETTQSRLREHSERLPETARESTNAVRRAIEDQIRALDQLSGIAQDSRRQRDISPAVGEKDRWPNSSGQGPSGQGGSFGGRPGRASGGATTNPSAPAQQGGYVRSRTSAPRDAGSDSALAGERIADNLTAIKHGRETMPGGNARVTPPRPITRPITGPITGPSTGPSTGPATSSVSSSGTGSFGSRDHGHRDTSKEGWSLGDLLKRASDGEGALTGTGQAGSAAGSLSSGFGATSSVSETAASSFDFSMKSMAGALDAQTAAQLWARYRSGDLDNLARDIYTARGQRAYDEVAKRCKSDAGFNTMVDRYLVDFERMLKETSHRDDTGNTAQTLLLSEPGRVYLLLAHASGRLHASRR